MIHAEIRTKYLNRLFGRLEKNAKQTQPLMGAIASDMMADSDEKFRSESGVPASQHNNPRGGTVRRWVGLAESTKKARARKGDQGKPMLDISGARGLKGKRQLRHTNNTASIGIFGGVKYARIHELGGRAGRKHKSKIPDRSYLHLSIRDIARINKRIGKYLIK